VVASPMLVYAAAPAGQYVVTAGSGTGNGTVYDTKSKLTWQQTVSSTAYRLADAKTYCAGVGASLGGTGWRVPTIKELLSIVDFSSSEASIDPNAFPSNPVQKFWSSSPVAGSQSDAWLVYWNGIMRGGVSDYGYYVRCVR